MYSSRLHWFCSYINGGLRRAPKCPVVPQTKLSMKSIYDMTSPVTSWMYYSWLPAADAPQPALSTRTGVLVSVSEPIWTSASPSGSCRGNRDPNISSWTQKSHNISSVRAASLRFSAQNLTVIYIFQNTIPQHLILAIGSRKTSNDIRIIS